MHYNQTCLVHHHISSHEQVHMRNSLCTNISFHTHSFCLNCTPHVAAAAAQSLAEVVSIPVEYFAVLSARLHL